MSVVNAQRTAQLVYPISMDVFINFIITPKIFVLNLHMSRLFAVKGQDKDAPDSSHCFIANILTQVSNHKSEDENFHITFKIIGNHKNFVDKTI